MDHVYFSLLIPTFCWQSVNCQLTVGRLYHNEGNLELWYWQEKELTVSCTSCEDERNALWATRKAADGILGLRCVNLSGKNWKQGSWPKDDHFGVAKIDWGTWTTAQLVLPHLSHSRAFPRGWGIQQWTWGNRFWPWSCEESGVWSAPPQKWWFLAKAHWPTACRSTVGQLSADNSTNRRPTINSLLTDYQPSVSWQLADMSTDCRLTYRLTVDWQGAKVHMRPKHEATLCKFDLFCSYIDIFFCRTMHSNSGGQKWTGILYSGQPLSRSSETRSEQSINYKRCLTYLACNNNTDQLHVGYFSS